MTSGATNWRGVAFGLALAVLAAYQLFKVPPVLPGLIDAYGYDLVLAGGFMSVYAVAGLTLSLRLGRLMQRFGARPFLLAAFGLMTAGNLLTLALPQYGVAVLLARGIEGIAFAILAIAGPVFVNLNASPRQLPLAIGMLAGWIPVGQMIANLLAPVAVAVGQWQLLWWGAMLTTLAVAGWTFALGRTGGVDLSARVRAMTRSGEGSPEPAELPRRHRLTLAVTAMLFTLWSAQYYAYMTWLPQYLVEVRGFSHAGAVWGYSVPVLSLLAFNLITGLMLRAGVPVAWLLTVGLASQGVVWWLIPVTGGGFWGLVSLVAYGIGAGLTPTCLFAVPSTVLGPGRAGSRAFGILMTGRNLGVLIGPVLLAQTLRWFGDWNAAGPIFGAAMAVATVGALVLWRRLPAGRG